MLGIIGGTGFYRMDGVEILHDEAVPTPFGPPSAPVAIGRIGSREVAFPPRHGKDHVLLPSEINYRANIFALKSVGVTEAVSISAVGSLVEDMAPGSLALPSQYFDWTKGKRASSFFGDGLVGHIATAEPLCPRMRENVLEAERLLPVTAPAPIHPTATYACVEGPRLGTRAESFFLKGAGCDLVGMTNIPEAFLAREAQICYAAVAVVTDYDSWHEDPSFHVSMEAVISQYRTSLDRVRELLRSLCTKGGEVTECGCRRALQGAVLTPRDALSEEKRRLLDLLER